MSTCLPASLASCSCYSSCYNNCHSFVLLSHRNKVLREITKKSGGRGTQCGCCKHCLRRAKSFRRFRNTLSENLHRLNFWHKTLKIIGGEFGTSVLSYFIFLKWLLNFNIFSFLINFGFITIPQIVTAEPNNLSFTGLELLTGAGYFQQTVLYYGFYTNATISQTKNGASYNMQLAYIFTVGIYFVICLLILVFSMAKSFCRNFINPQMYSGNASKLICAWDFNITNEKAVKLQQKNLSTQIKVENTGDTKSCPAVILSSEVAYQLPVQLMLCFLCRTIILKISIVGILCYYWLNVVAASESQCWETLIGQDIYRLVLVDFIFCLLGSFFGEFLRRIIGTTVCVSLGVPEFDIGRSVLDLIYAQTLTWIGILFSPLLPGIQMISFSIVFYVKKVSLMRNCQPPRKAWRAAQMTTFFMFLLFFPSLVGVVSVIAVTVWRLKPSKECGPFRGLPSIYTAISEWVKILENYIDSRWVAWVYYNLITSELFFFILSTLILVITYLYWQIIRGRRTMAKLLCEQIVNVSLTFSFILFKILVFLLIVSLCCCAAVICFSCSNAEESGSPPVCQLWGNYSQIVSLQRNFMFKLCCCSFFCRSVTRRP
uniref:Transmembrane channel-like protein n=1 Tax=Phasianus colchicus TaxID=9054 RepID=A0A669QHS9_PHACC